MRDVQPIQARGGQGMLIDLRAPVPEEGEQPPQRMLVGMFPAAERTWFIKTTAPEPLIAAHHEAFVSLCRSVRFAGSAAADTAGDAPAAGHAEAGRRESSDGGPAWTLPAGWKAEAQPRPMSVASFTVTEGGAEAVVTLTPLAGPPQVLGNINRWRGQVGLDPLERLEAEPPAPITVAGDAGHYVNLDGPAGQMLGVIAPRGDQTWFFKMTGPGALLAAQEAAFKSFVGSIRFDGASDG
jgi:hypothetical protein